MKPKDQLTDVFTKAVASRVFSESPIKLVNENKSILCNYDVIRLLLLEIV